MSHTAENKRIWVWRTLAVLIPWTTIFTMFSVGAEKYTRLKDVIDNAPAMEERTIALERRADLNDERWKRVENWLQRIDNKIDIERSRNR